MHQVKTELEQNLSDEMDGIKSLIVVFSMVLVCLTITAFFYLICYPVS